MNLQKAVAKRISELLIKEKISQYELAKRANLTKQAISNIINEKYESIKFDTVFKLADGFNMTILEFLNSDFFNRENIDID